MVFIGVEGKSDRAFVRFLGHICDDERLHLHLDIKPGGGGDSLAVVETARRRLRKHPDPRSISKRLVLLDSDRMEADREADRDARAKASKWGIEVVLINPNLEGLLVRLHEGHETRLISASDAARALRKLWPDYQNGWLTAKQLKRRFDFKDVRRAARHDEALRKLLELLGL
ncbi:MAG: hypothetical protein F4151_02015 [Gammaproteobacteria bacterium]|nr:hypothetical protein [Gammaproteobacteria bacterium]